MEFIAATGHRPDKLGGYSPEIFQRLVNLAKTALFDCHGVITGMALGWDTAIAEAAVNMKIPFIAAVPCDGQDNLWPPEAKERYARLLNSAKEVVVVNPGAYQTWKMQARNEWMVDHAVAIIALWDGSIGGTANCIEYANKKGIPVTNVWTHWEHNVIGKFDGTYRFLSNFYPAPTMFDGDMYLSSEAAYQAAKLERREDRQQFQTILARDAKRLGKTVPIRPGWDQIKVGIMLKIVMDKFTRNEDLRRQLLLTGDAILIEGNTWGDQWWGLVRGRGENYLGKILMEVRSHFSGKSLACISCGNI